MLGSVPNAFTYTGEVRVGNDPCRVELAAPLKGRCVPDDCYWVIDEEHPEGRVLQVRAEDCSAVL